MQTLHGSLPEASTWPMLTRHLMIFVLPACPFFPNFLAAIPWIVSATRTRSSALSNYAGRPTLNSLDNASSTKMKSSRLRTEPWCTPTLTLKAFSSLSLLSFSSLHPDTLLFHQHYPFIHTQLPQWAPIKPPHQAPFRTLSPNQQRSWYFSCSWRNIKIASVKRRPPLNPNGMLSISHFFSPYFQWFFTDFS